MRPPRTAARIVVAASAAVIGAVLLAPSVSARDRFPARMLVYADEWTLAPSRATVPAGRVTVQLWNRGMDPHDLRVRRLNRAGAMVGRAQGAGVTDPGDLTAMSWRLRRGSYELYCSMPGHLARGMHVRIRVR